MTGKNSLGIRGDSKRSKEKLEELIDVPVQSQKLIDDLEHSNGVVTVATDPILVIKVTSALFEIEFIKTLCTKSRTSEDQIQTCCMLPEKEDEAVPVGYMVLTFENINKILTYNNKFKLLLFDSNNLSELTANQIMCLP